MFGTMLMCPNCRGVMRNQERGGALVDQCSDCGGAFLDRSELERLLTGEFAPLPIYEELAYKGRHRRGARVSSAFLRGRRAS